MELGTLGNGANGKQLEGMIGQKAAATQLFQTKSTRWKRNNGDGEPDNNQIKANIGLFFVLIYVVSMILSTLSVQQQYRKRYLADFDAVEYMLLQSKSEDVVTWVNSIGGIKSASDGQFFSAAVYDAKGNLLTATGTNLCIPLQNGNTLNIQLDEYFKKEEVQNLFVNTERIISSHRVRVVIDKSTGKPYSIQVGEGGYLLNWQDATYTLDEENSQAISRELSVRQLISAPYGEDEDDCTKWAQIEYLHDFPQNIDVKENKKQWTIPLYGDSKQERITRVSMKNDEGVTTDYYLALRATGNTLGETVDVLTTSYFVGLALTIAGIIAVDRGINKIKKK